MMCFQDKIIDQPKLCFNPSSEIYITSDCPLIVFV